MVDKALVLCSCIWIETTSFQTATESHFKSYASTVFEIPRHEQLGMQTPTVIHLITISSGNTYIDKVYSFLQCTSPCQDILYTLCMTFCRLGNPMVFVTSCEQALHIPVAYIFFYIVSRCTYSSLPASQQCCHLIMLSLLHPNNAVIHTISIHIFFLTSHNYWLHMFSQPHVAGFLVMAYFYVYITFPLLYSFPVCCYNYLICPQWSLKFHPI